MTEAVLVDKLESNQFRQSLQLNWSQAKLCVYYSQGLRNWI